MRAHTDLPASALMRAMRKVGVMAQGGGGGPMNGHGNAWAAGMPAIATDVQHTNAPALVPALVTHAYHSMAHATACECAAQYSGLWPLVSGLSGYPGHPRPAKHAPCKPTNEPLAVGLAGRRTAAAGAGAAAGSARRRMIQPQLREHSMQHAACVQRKVHACMLACRPVGSRRRL